MAKKKIGYDFSEETVKKRRKFPVGRAILLTVLILLQVLCVVAIINYEPSPQDVIDKYEVYVTPKSDGTLDIEYKFTWTPLDIDEPLTFVYVGIANPDYSLLNYSTNIVTAERYDDYEGECHIDLYLDRDYYRGETIEFSFSINQRSMLCERNG